MLFCLRHWRMTPKTLQAAIWRTYRKGQEITKTPTALYLVVQSITVAWVARREGRFTEEQFSEFVKARIERVWHRLSNDDVDYLHALVEDC